MNIFIFGDQTSDQYPLLKLLLHRKRGPVLSSFLGQCVIALRGQISLLCKTRRRAIPGFTSIHDLVERYNQQASKSAELESSFVTISQIAHYILLCENQKIQPAETLKTQCVGLCTGLLAAAAVASARCLSELIPIALEAVKISFRIGTRIGLMGDAIESDPIDSSSWSTIVANTSTTDVVSATNEFNRNSGLTRHRIAYVSAFTTGAVTISGPPSVTSRLFHECQFFEICHRVPLPIYGPYHAAHLFSASDTLKILDSESQNALRLFRPQMPIRSAVNGRIIETQSALELMQILIEEILSQPMRWDKLLGSGVTEIVSSVPIEIPCFVNTFGLSNAGHSISSALQAAGWIDTRNVDHTAWLEDSECSGGRLQNEKIAIVGMAGRFPDAANHEALWDLLMQGLDVYKQVPKDRFDAQAHFDPLGKGKNKSHTPYGCFIKEPGLFDPRFFNMSPREAAQTDPMGRLALVTAYEALEMSGYVPNRTPSTMLNRIGTFYGQTSDDWREINAAEDIDTYFITGGVRAFVPGRINYYFKFSGPSFSIDTACSSSLAAIQLACTSLWAGDCDMACTGGLNVLTNPDIFAGLSKGQFLSKTGSCKTYDDNADGYCRGDGVGSVILKRYSDAIADKDHILGCILSAATNHSAEAVSITHPHAGAQEFLYKKVLSDAGVDAHDISYVEMHGTGTQAGDGVEMTSVTNVFAPNNRQRRPDQKLFLGAVKANIGHGEASSGTNSLVKVLMMMRENYIPPNIGIKGTMNRTFPQDLKERNVHIPQHAVAFPRNGSEKRKIFLNNFSAAGGNTAILLEDGPLTEGPKSKDPRSHQIISVSARAISSLRRNLESLVHYLDTHPNASISSLSYTLSARRLHHNYRIAFPASDLGDAKFGLSSHIKESYSPISMVSKSVCFVFTGQGSQYTGLACQLYQESRRFRDDINWLNDLVMAQNLPSFLPLIQGSEIATLCPVVVQLGLSCVQVSLARMWLSFGVKPVAVLGHSLGEYAALHISGVISANDMITLVGRRAELIIDCCTAFTHGMLAVRCGEEIVSSLLGSKMLEVACKNSNEDIVLCGTIDQVQCASTVLAASMIKVTPLKVPFAFHSSQVDPILEALIKTADNVIFRKPQIPLLSPLHGRVIRESSVIGPEYLARHARESVNFPMAIQAGQAEGLLSSKSVWIEVGAHPHCTNMLKKNIDPSTLVVASLRRDESAWKTITTSLSNLYVEGVDVDFEEYHRDFNESQELLVLPEYNFDNKTYWLDYHNNWTLTKGENPNPVSCNDFIHAQPEKFSTTSCQRIIKEEFHANTGSVVFQSNLAESKLSLLVTGHLVNDNPLCPSSLYADQAITAADYLYKRLRPKAEPVGTNVCKMEVPKPLIAKLPTPKEGQHIQIVAKADLDAGEACIKYRSVTHKGKEIIEHARCIVKYERMEDWQESFDTTSYLVKTQIEMLRQKLHTGHAHKLLRGMAYKLFNCFVKYSPKFRGMSEVIINSNEFEATAIINFQSSDKDGSFMFAPYWIDSLCHLSGFICNATDLIDSENNISISHGWTSMRFLRPLSPEKTYCNYVRMLPKANNVRSGDVYIFEDDDLVGIVGGLKFQEIPRRLMNAMLPPPKAPSNVSPSKEVAVPKAQKLQRDNVSVIKTLSKPLKKTKTIPKKRPSSAEISSSLTSKVMKIIADETDVDLSELIDQAAFENLGVDSLLSLTISAKFREELNIDIPSTLFADHTTIGALKNFFTKFDKAEVVVADTSSDSSDDFEIYSANTGSSNTTPPSSPPSSSDSDEEVQVGGICASHSLVRLTIAQEMGVEACDIDEKAELTNMGMDSLMSLTVLSILRERTGIDLPATFLVTNPTIEEVEEALDMRPRSIAKSTPPSKQSRSHKTNELIHKYCIDASKYPKASSVLLQGNSKTATTNLFCFPDGSGSATSYASIPMIDSKVAVYAMNCPFMKRPREFTVGIDGVATLYLNEMKRRQRVGPYFIGGWSAGGVVAYEVACQLLAQGEKVAKLLLFDSPCPIALEPLPSRLHHFFDEIGLLGSNGVGSRPEWLLPHFESSIKALSDYVPSPVPKSEIVETFAIWAREGVCGKPGDLRPPPAKDEDSKPMKWLLDNRIDFGDNGWAQLLGLANMKFGVMDGNHFTMMNTPHAETLCQLIRQGLGLQ